MARHPADIMATLTVRVPRGHQGFWEIIRTFHRQGKNWTLADIDGESNVNISTVRDFILRLERAGYIAAVYRPAVKDHTQYRLCRDQPEVPRVRRDGTAAREPGLGQDQMWRSMKMLATFDALALSLHSTTGEVPVPLIAAKSYIVRLKRAGYLAEVSPAKPGHRPGTGKLATYRLLPSMNTGPMAPQIQSTDWVWDPNRRKVMGPEACMPAKRGGK